MLKTWLPLIKELVIILLAVCLFQVLYDVLVRKIRLKTALFGRFMYLLSGPWGRVAIFVVFIGIVFLIYTLVFE